MILLEDPVTRESPAEDHPLSWGQRALWMAERLAPEEAPYNLAAAGRVLGEIDAGALRRAFEILTARHPALRTTFHEIAPGEPVQRVHRAMAPDVEVVEISLEDLRPRLAEEAWRPFDLEIGPPLRVRLFTGMPEGAVLLVAVHHLAADLASLSILGQELGALLRDEAAELPPVPAGPAEWARQRERLADERRGTWWREHLSGELPVLALPTDRPRPPILTVRGDSRVLRLGPETLDALRAVVRAEGATLWAALLASVGAWLHRITGQEVLLLGSPVSLRTGPFAAALGYFVELTVLREDLSGRPSFAELLRRARREAFSALRHAGYPFALLAERLESTRDPSRHPVVQVLLALQGAGLAAFALAEEGDRTPLGDLELEGVAIPERRLPFDLALLAAETEGGLAISCQFNAALFDGSTVERLLAAFETLLSGMTADPGRPVAELPLLGEAERAQILGEWSGAGVEAGDGEDCLHDLVLAQARRTPEATAVVHGTERTTYEELAHRAGELAATLRGMGIAPEARVGVLVDRGPEMVVSVLGVLAAGGAYVPLDPTHPEERRRTILEDAGISALVTRSGVAVRDPGGVPGRPSPRNLAYVLYTSGSTGRPKGVAVEHRSAVARVRWAGEVYPPEDLAGVLAATSLGFDLSVFELFVPLSHGGAVILADDALALPDLPARGEVTLINTVPSALAELLRAGAVPATVRAVNLAGEALPEALAGEVHRRLPGSRLFNLYGPTEDTVYSTFARVLPGEGVPIGRPLGGTRIHVLDRGMEPLPAGVLGELFLGGAGQARGYLGRPDLTAERFVPDPFVPPGGRLYRTGDLVRFRADGALDFLGRIDHQVKVRGFRVELGEIEAALARHPAVEAAVVILREDRLVAYVVGAASPDDLRSWLRASLPGPMIPSAFVILDRLPLTPNGKVDRRALPVPVEAAPEDASPATPAEEILAGIVADVLGVGRVGVRESFFDLGGHSLLAARVVSLVREALGAELPLRALFEEPTVSGLARRILAAEAPAAPPLVARPRPAAIPLSFAQERLWFLWSLAPESPFYNMPAALRLTGPLSVPALAGTFEEIVRRQEALRTRFPATAGGPVQAIDPPSPVPLPVVDLEGLPEAAREAERLSLKEARRPFDLATGPVLRTTLLRLGREEHLLLVTMHHLVSDGWSIAVLHRDFADLYPALAAGRPSPLAPLPVQYADFTLWQRERPFQSELAWWRERLADLPPGDLPSDRPRPAVQTFRGATLRGRLPAERTAELRALSRKLGTTLFMTLLAGFEAVALRWTGREDAVTGAPVAGRDRLELDRVVGFFVNTLVLRTDLSGRPGFAGLARRVRETALGAWAHQALPFEQLVEELAPERDLAFQPLFQRMFQLLEMPPERIGLGDLAVERAEIEQGAATFDLALDLVDDPGGVIVKAVYSTDLFDGATIERFLGHFERLLAAAAADPERPVTELPILSEAERRQLEAWSLGPEIPDGGSLLERFAAHVERAPDKVAVVFEGTMLTYGELDRRSDRLARILAERGVGPERVVGVLLDRSPELIESLLGILKAGGAYLPMDSGLPRERLAYFVENAGASLVLTVPELAGKLAGVETILLDQLPASGDGEEDGRAVPLPQSLAYLIYTSGSTGRPKAVGVSYEVLSGHVRAMVRAYGVGPEDRILSFAAPGFDVSVEQILMALTAGAAVVLRPNELWEPAGLPRRLADLGVTVADLPPAYWNQLAVELEGQSVPEPRPRLVAAGGDVMQAEPLRRWMRGPWAGVRLFNVYGPTETTITSTAADVTGRGPTAWERVPIGRPLPGRTHFVLDPEGNPVPPGVPGEVCVGGPLLARGYLGRPDLTAERFVPDPWSTEPGGRLYRTGDLARYLPDGELEFAGRTDTQIKIRGFRIEPREIEAALASHPAVRQAVAMAREDRPGDRRLAAYVTLDMDRLEEALAGGLESEQVEEWRAVYDDDVFGEIPDPTFNIKGWDSRYTRGPIPAEEMREWLDGTVARILSLSPRRVLEIGCGTGLLLFPLAPRTERYLGIDFSEPSLAYIRAVLDTRGWPAGTELRRGLADDEAVLGGETFDTVVLNSIVQYFPSLAYLLRVVESAVARVRPGGAVFLGDLRSLPLLEASHLSVELFRAEGSMDRERLRRQVEAALAAEPELVFHPALFSALTRRLPRITHVEVQLRRGWADNELTRFRYDAVLHVEHPGPPEPAWLDWEEVLSLASLRERLLAGPDLLAVRGLPNERVREDVAALALLADPDGPRTADELRRAAAAGEPGLHPETVWELGEELGYAVGVTWSTDPGRFNAVFQRSKGLLPGLAPEAPADLAGLANDPLKRKAAQKIVPVLRSLCEERLPAWMVPPDLVVLDALPVTVRGKVDLKALPAPERERPEPAGEAALPQTPEERALASLWSELLGVDRVGLHDNFFALGGHSLLATQVVSRVRQAFAVELPLRHLFEAPTVAGLAARLRSALAEAGRLPLPPVEPVPREGDLPLSFGQQRLWFLHRMAPDAPGYLMAGAFRLSGNLSVPALAAALSEVVRRHEVLRSTYHEGPVQRIHPPRPVSLPVVDLSGITDGGEEIRRLVHNEASQPFDLERDLMVRGTLLRLGEREHVALLTLHHIASDGWSVDVLVRELAALYGASPLPGLPIQYGDFAVWQRRWLDGPVLEGQLAWWKARLAGTPPVLELPTDRPRPPVRTSRGGRRAFAVPPDLAAALQDLATREGTTLFVLLLAVWQALLGRITHQEDLVVGTPVAGRRQAETEDLIGFFVNTLVLRADLAGDPAFRDFLARVHEGALDAFSHQDLPFERLVEELRPERRLAHTPLFQVTFSLQYASRVPLELPGLTLAPLPFEPEAKFDLELTLAETEDGLEGTLDFAVDLFDPATAERLTGLYGSLLGEIVARPGDRLSDLDPLSEAERQQLVEWGCGAALTAEGTVLDLFDAQVERTPDATAVIAGDTALAYRDLARRADAMAAALIDRGVQPGDIVGLQVERTADLAIGLLGIWKAGAAFLPLDLSYPEDRRAFMVQDAGARIVLAEIPSGSGPGVRPRAADLAYLIYTSGTTGTPKAVMVEHGSLVHTLRATAAVVFGFEAGERIPSIAPFSFDIFLFELLSPLLSGGTAVLLRSPDLLLDELSRSTRFHAVPALLRQVVDRAGSLERYAGLREIYTGGDTVPADLLAAARAAFPSARLRVLYGPTEGTIVCSFHTVGTEARPLLGRPFPGVSLRLLDPWGNPVPVGVPGEIHIGGPGVARGYLGRPDLTAERFVPAPGGARLYRTGDLARFRPDGSLEFLGRVDAQVKVRGVRIEPGEVEARLAFHPGVRQAAVVAREEPGGRILAAFYVPAGEAPEAGELRSFLARNLPEAMIPSRFIPLDALPLTANAKVNRSALARRELRTPEAPAAPRTPLEEILARLFAEVIGVERVGVRDGFFALGGHSLLATRLVSRVREALGVELPLPALFEEPTVAGLARRIGSLSGAVLPPLHPVPRDKDLPLSFAQQRLWFLDRMTPGASLYHMPALLRLTGPLDVAALAAAFSGVVRRHEALRTTFPARGGEPRQEIHSPHPIPLPVVDLAGVSEDEAWRLGIAETRRPFDLAAGPLLRALLLRLGPEEHVLAVTMHHIISDGESVGVLVRELAALYGGSTLPDLPIQYGDFAVWQRRWLEGPILESQLAWWKERLAGVPPVLELPTDRPRPAVRTGRGGRHAFTVSPELSAALRELAAREGTTLFVLLLAVWQRLLGRITHQEDLLVGTPAAGRRQAETENLIGCFVNTLVLRADLEGNPSFQDFLGRVHEATLAALDHQDLPFERLVEELNPGRSLAHTPLFQVTFAFQHVSPVPRELQGLTLRPLPLEPAAKFDLELILTETEEGLAGTLDFAADLFDPSTAESLAGLYGDFLREIAADLRSSLPARFVPRSVDRRVLAEMELPAPEREATPGTPAEEILTGLFAEALGVERVGVRDDFFALGGHSLLATRLVSRVRESLGVELPLPALFEAPTVAGLARKIEAARGGPALPPIRPVPREGELPLSFSQQRLWFLDQMEPGSPLYNLPALLRLGGALDPRALAAALTGIVRRHEALRTTFPARRGRPRQEIHSPRPVPLPVVDLAGIAGEEAWRLGIEEIRRPFDLAAGPLLRALLLRLGPEEHVLALTMHHIVSDGGSVGVFVRELAALYRGDPLPELPVQYADFAAWQREWLARGTLEEQLAAWRSRLAGAPRVLDLPADRPRPAVRDPRGAEVAFEVPVDLAEALASLGRREGTTLFMVLLAGFQALLSRITGQDDLLVGTPVAGRRRIEVEGLIGFFVNTLALRGDLSGRPTVQQLLAQVRGTALAAYEHQDLPFERLVEELEPARDPSRTPLVQVVFALQDLASGRVEIPGLGVEPVPAETDTAKFDLTLTLAEQPYGGLAGTVEYATSLFDPVTVKRLAERFVLLLSGVAGAPEKTVDALPLLSEAERRQLLEWGGDTVAAYPRERTIPELFAEQVALAPDRPAVSFGEVRWTYGELAHRAGRLARRLRELGVGPEVAVAVFLDRTADLPAALLAILQAGGAYVPLDPAYPAERIAFMLRDCGAPVLLAGRDLPEGAAVPGVTVLHLDRGWNDLPDGEPGPPVVSPESLAYVIYTSGSTGRPKGVTVPHRAVVRLVRDTDYVRLGRGDRVAQASNASFDAATFEIWGALLNGGELVGLDREATLSPARLAATLRESRIDSLFLTTALFNRIAAEAPAAFAPVRDLLFGGEAVDPGAVRRVLEPGAPHRLLHVYGPTENTTFSTWHPVAEVPPGAATVPVGRPIAHTTVHLLDRELRPVPVGSPGEICLGRNGLARGYLGRPDLTAAAFVPDPEGVGERLYRTGDLARWRPDGAIEFLGRFDGQVKVRGFRIELGEVEAALAAHLAVRQAAVFVREDRPGDRGLVAFLEGAPRDTAGLCAFLKDRLPAFMIPSAFVWVDSLPLNANGKVDRRALAALPVEPEAREGFALPRTPVEEGIAAIWREVLGTGAVSREDDFFERGGHSLLATQVASRLRETFGVDLPLRDLFAFPRLADLAARVEEERRVGAGLAAPPIVPVPRPPEGLPLSFAQEWMWVVDQLDPEAAAYNAPIPVRLAGELDVDALESALRETAARHEILRTVFVPGPLQRAREEAEVPFVLADLSALPPDWREAEAVHQAIEEAKRPFDLVAGPPVRALLLRLSPADHRLVLDLHHIVTDGWSAGVLLREIAALYTREELTPLPVQYADFAVWQRNWFAEETLNRLLDHWRERLAGPLPVLELPADRPRTATIGALGERLPFALTWEEADAFRRLARQRGATLFAALLAGFEALLHRIAHQDDLLVGTPVAGRTRRETEDLVGYFVNNLVLRTDLSGDPAFENLVDRVQETSLDAWSHQDLPLPTLVQALHPERARPGAMPLFQAWFQLQNTPVPAIELPGLALSPWEIETSAATFDLELLTMEAEDGLRGHLVVNRDLFRRETAERLLGWLLTLLRGAAAAPERRLSELPLLSGEELAQILAQAGPAAAFPDVLPLHRAFEARVAEAPDAPAVTFEGETLSYAALDRRANRLAWHLRSLGVGPETRVGLAFPRSLDLIVAILGILKAGGAYVPLDPDYPRERLDFLVADAGLRVVLTPEDLPETGPETSPEVDIDPDALAYVIYTSGSTGRPKGVMVTHRQAARLFAASASFGFGPADVWTLLHSYAFDFSVWEIWGALLHGGRLVVVPRWVARSPEAFRALLAREGVTVLNQTPSAFYQLMQVDEGALRLRWVIFGGEALEPAKLRPWFERHGDERPVLVNMFGITETTVHVTHRPLSRTDLEAGSVIGAPLPDLSLHLLDRSLQPVPPGVVGEIFVGGSGVARGYHGRPDLTAERFLPDPFSAEPGARLYRSGDLARRLADGEVEYLGRADQQLKVRGFRIEPGEIESALVRHETLGEAAVLARRVSAEDVRLVAFLVPRAGRELPSAEELRNLLLETLPEHMVPASFVPLPALPLTPHGKVDRRTLADLGETAEAPRAGAEAPANPLEERLAALWAELLEVDSVGRDESFFALGGHSLLMTRVATRVREELGVSIPMKSFFDRPTVAGLAEAIAGVETPAERVVENDPRAQRALRTTPVVERLISTVAFPTANRPDVLARGLESYAQTAPHRRFLVMDDSKDAAFREEYRRRLRDLQGRLGVTILYAGLEEKRRFAADLAAEAGVDPVVTEAALLDPLGIGLTVGANRNAVLLATVGEGVLSVDDDTLSLVAPSPGSEEGEELFSGTSPGTAFLSGRDPGEIRAFAGRAEALASLDLRPADLAGLHEGMLGQPVLVTTNGWAGDCGWHSPSFYMLLEGESRRRLVRTAEGYSTATASKEIVRSVPRTTLGDGDSFMATLFTGLDNRRLLPPFPPVLWGEDLLFGITLQLCFREARVGHLPWVAAHEPVEVRRFWPGEMARSASGVDHSRLVSALLDGFVPDLTEGPAEALRRLGRYLLELGEMAPADFDALALRSVRSRAEAFAAELEARLAAFDPAEGEGAALWAADVRRYLDVLRKHAAEPDFGVPLDLLYGRDVEEARRLAQRLIANHGLVLFHWPELVEAAWRLKERGRGLAEEIRGVSAVSFGQERLWLQDRLSPGSAAYNTANALRLTGRLDVPLLERCFAEIARRHEVLRSTFAEPGGIPVQVVHPPAPVELPVTDLSALPEEIRTAEGTRLLNEEFLIPFNLVRGPLTRVRLVRLAAEEHVLLLTFHHIISDAWSMGVITRELATLHAAFAAGHPSPLPPLPLQYADYARAQREWMAGPELPEQLAWWRERLAGAPEALEIPTDRPRPAVRRFRGGMRTVRLPDDLAESVRTLCCERGLTLFMALLAAFEVLLHARTGEDDLVVGVDVAGRTLPGTEELVGFFVNQLVLRMDLCGDPKFSEVLARVRETALEAFAHQDLPFGRLVEELAPKRSLARNPLFQVMFGLYNVPEADLDLGGIAVSPVDIEGGAAVFDLSLYMAEAGDGLLGMLRYDADLFEAATIDRLLEEYETLLRRAVTAPEERVSALLAHLAAERRSRIEAERESLSKARLKTLKTARRRPHE